MPEHVGALHHIVRMPTRQVPVEGFPLLVLLHGYGSDEKDLMGLAPYLDPNLLMVSARAPQVLECGGYSWFPIVLGESGIVLHFEEAWTSCAQVCELVEILKANYPVDPQKIFLVGFSQGASISVAVALQYPELCAGVAALSGVCVEEMLPADRSTLENLQVLIAHGRLDQLVPIHQGRSSHELLSSLPLDLTYKEYEMGHEISHECLQDLRNWLRERL